MINWQRAAVGGVIAGIVFVMMEMILVTFALDGSPWGPPRMMAAIIMGTEVLPPPATFDMGLVMAGMVLHLVLSAVYGIIVAILIRNASMGMAMGIGAIFGLALYFINFYGFTMIFEWFANARNWVTLLSHIVFGIVAAWYYRAGISSAATRQPTSATT